MSDLVNASLAGAGVNTGASVAGAVVGGALNNYFAKKNARYQDKLQRNFMLDSGSMDRESKRRAGVSPWSQGQSQQEQVSVSSNTPQPDLSHVGDSVSSAKIAEKQQAIDNKIADSTVEKNEADAKNALAQEAQTKTQTAIFANQLAEQVLRGELTKNFVRQNRSHFDKYIGSTSVDNFLNSQGFGLSTFGDIKNMITHQGQGWREYQNFVEGDVGPAHQFNIAPDYFRAKTDRNKVENEFFLGTNQQGIDARFRAEEIGVKREQNAIAWANNRIQSRLVDIKDREVSVEERKQDLADAIGELQKEGLTQDNAIKTYKSQIEKRITEVKSKISDLRRSPKLFYDGPYSEYRNLRHELEELEGQVTMLNEKDIVKLFGDVSSKGGK